MKKEEVVLVNERDEVVGYREKLLAHQHPVPLHRAVSVMIVEKGKILMQKRGGEKPTWPLKWSNACCTHPRKGENYKAAAERRLAEEMGIKSRLREVFRFSYKARYDEIWGENELDVVFCGECHGKIQPDPKEVDSFKWMKIGDVYPNCFGLQTTNRFGYISDVPVCVANLSTTAIKQELKEGSEAYTPWFEIIFAKIFK